VPPPPPAPGQWTPPPGTIDWGTVIRGTHRDRRSLTVANNQQYYGFTLTGQTRVVIHLTGLRDDADLALLDATGNILQTSSHSRRRNETISVTLAPGTYYVRSYLVGSAGTAFRISMTDTPVKLKKVKTPHHKRR